VSDLIRLLEAIGAGDHRATMSDLAQWTTGRGGTGSEEARAEQEVIVALLARARAKAKG
jgi:hypothetical protein